MEDLKQCFGQHVLSNIENKSYHLGPCFWSQRVHCVIQLCCSFQNCSAIYLHRANVAVMDGFMRIMI